MRELVEPAPAKVNLTLGILGRRDDGYHTLESLVVFADIGDRLTLVPGKSLELELAGRRARECGPIADNLVLKAAQALASKVGDLRLGRLTLVKSLPVAAGLGGGSADAAAALRLLAKLNKLAVDDPRIMAVARATGADVPVCVDPRPRVMTGIGEILSPPLRFPKFPAVLVNPGVAAPTKDVFATLGLRKGERRREAANVAVPTERTQILQFLAGHPNDLEEAAIRHQPVIAEVLAQLRVPGSRLARMSGSGATCFGLFDTRSAARATARKLQAAYPQWWVRATMLG
jgi:4-diphosphocytidyl-2-C-methyl-D-erythritol kinase